MDRGQKVVFKTVESANEVTELLNKFIRNGWSLNNSFIQIVPDNGKFHIFYGACMDRDKYHDML